ncbi:MAG: lamin tail domain-containing protein [Phycisphaerae bacterium]|nr:lamin tail domain-containing protein [Phycisphaerae bacterium]
MLLCVFCLFTPAFSQDVQQALVINEVHYDPDVKTELVEFIEIFNPGPSRVSLKDWQIADAVVYTFPDVGIEPDAYMVVAQTPSLVRNKWHNLAANQVLGPFEGKLSNQGEQVTLIDPDGMVVDQVDYQLGFPWPTVGVPLSGPGSGASIQLVNPDLDNDLGGAWRSESPTPGQSNSRVYSLNADLMIRQVKHTPNQPLADEAVVISAKITDPDGFLRVFMQYQVVEPGQYVGLDQIEYQLNWVMVDMHDDGLNGDEQAGDGTFSVLLNAAIQKHRRLIRYRVGAIDTGGQYLTVPYDDDPCPNFAYFVYNGVPAWQGAVRPGQDSPVVYHEHVMNSLPVYHLISRQEDVEASTWRERYGGDEYKWWGTLIYDGEVYDHIRYRARGGVWRYAMGKNMWKFDFNHGHSFQARDDYGKKYNTTWSKLNLSACIQQGDYGNRGEQGMFEAASFRLFNMMGAPASKTHWLQLRIIDETDETGATQYEGDYWGLYMAIEQMDGRFLDEHKLPDGNLYKIEGSGVLNNQGPTAVTNGSDLNRFMSQYRNASEQWWRDNVNLESYYGYRCVVEGVHQGDIGYGKNYFFYLNPETGLWSQLPWDTDLTWAETMYGNGQEPFISQGRIFNQENLDIEYKNRMREFLDLLYNQDQMGQMIEELAAVIHDPHGGLSPVDADRAMWDYNPVMKSSYVNGSKAGQGRFYQAAATQDFPGMIQLMKDYVEYCTNNRRNWMGMGGASMTDVAQDNAIPDTPVIRYAGESDYASNDLFFEVSPFSDPKGQASFAALQWRMAEVEPFSHPGPAAQGPDSTSPGHTLIDAQEIWKYYRGENAPSGSETLWRVPGYDDASWDVGQGPIGYGEAFVQTVLDDMRYNYTTVYLRKAFTVDTDAPIETLTLEVRFDDAIAVWLNGTLVVLNNVAESALAYNAVANGNNEVTDFTPVDLTPFRDLLVQGTNVLAVHLVNLSLTTSSDCFFDARLTLTEGVDDHSTDPASGPQTSVIVTGRRGHYEIDPVWQTDDITSFVGRIQIPSSEVTPHATYRVRCRMKDDTGRWSHWSAPEQFMVTDSVATSMHSQLRITEIMFNPRDPGIGSPYNNDDYEFIEVTNIGSQVLDLSSVTFTQGIDFDFIESAITSLSPGDSLLIVENVDAFVERYGTSLQPQIAGEFKGKLSNGGETLQVADMWQGVILDFTYDDKWYSGTDGDGLSLELVNEDLGALGQAAAWRASQVQDGTPGSR